MTYKMPPEWALHERTFMAWPVKSSMVFPEEYIEVGFGYAEIAKAIAEFEPVTLIVNQDQIEIVQVAIGNDPNIDLLVIPHSDAWFRDNGPTFVTNEAGKVAGVNWTFNAWGGKYAPWDLDNAVAPQLLAHYSIKTIDAPIVMEGGSLHVDGEGTVLTTEECLLNENRNPAMSRADIEAKLHEYIGAEKVIWLDRGLDGDETDGHVDNIACYAAPGKIIMQVCDDPTDANYKITQDNLKRLSEATDARGRQLEVIQIPQPPYREFEGTRLTLSYLNFYFVNGGIILPVFGGDAAETDKQAEEILAKTFPDRRIRTVNGMAVIKEGGNVHCTTQQMPRSLA
jgi:agmatine deiminase